MQATLWGEMTAEYRLYINRDLPPIERCCASKAMFLSRREARAWVSHGRRSDGALDPYHCRYCEGWHVGHRRGRKARLSLRPLLS